MNEIVIKDQILRKGWCPTLSRPMETGDGLLVRLHIRHGVLSSEKARSVAACAQRYGNGHIDLTSRGNLQFRGVTPGCYEALLLELTKAGFTDEARPGRVANPQYLPPLGFLPTQDDIGTIGLGLAFGRLEVVTLHWLAGMAGRYGNGTILLSAWRTVFLPQIADGDAEKMIREAKRNGFIVDPHDPLRAIHTCPGAPACSSARGATRELALAIADKNTSGKTIHVSGCAKGCACPQKSAMVVTARDEGYDIGFDEIAGASPAYSCLDAQAVLKMVSAL